VEPKGPSHRIAKGPCAELEAELRKEWFFRQDPAEKAAIADARAQVTLLAFRDPVPEEDAEWARGHREAWRNMSLRPAGQGPSREAVMEAARKLLTSPEERTRLRRAEAEAKIRPIAPGPSAAREAELAKKLSWVEDPAEKEVLMAEYLALMDRAKKDPVPEEDAEWACIHREWDQDWLREFRPARRDIAAKLAYRAYCETEGIPVDENVLATRLPDEFYFVGDRMIDEFEEPEQETLAAVLAVYARRTGKASPRPSETWLAAIRKVREVLPKPHKP